MSRDILVSIPTRSRPDGAAAVMDLLLGAAADPDCFDFQLVIDSDQVELYRPVAERYPDKTIVGVAEPGCGGLRNVFIKQLEQFFEHGAYFLWSLSDDIYGVVNHWDRHITKTKNIFSDNIFLLGSGCLEQDRSIDVFNACYCLEFSSPYFQRAARHASKFAGLSTANQSDLDFLVALEFCELFPAYTRELARFIQKAFLRTDHQVGLDVVLAVVLQQLCRLTGQNRLVPAFPDNVRHICHCIQMQNVIGTFANNKPLDMAEIKAVAKEIASAINGAGPVGRETTASTGTPLAISMAPI